MYDENAFGGSPLEDIEYNAPTAKKEGPSGVAAPVLDDIDYVAPSSKKGGPTGVAAPVLDDMDAYVPPTEKKGAPTGVAAPVLDDNDSSYTEAKSEPEQLVLSDEDIINGLTPELLATFNKLPPENQKKVLDMRRAQLGAVAPAPTITAPVLDEDNYTPPPKKEELPKPAEPVTAPVLDDEPEPAKYVPKFVDEDLEKAKKEASKKAVAAQLVSDQKDSKESLRMMIQLKEERMAELAHKGFLLTIVAAVVGIVAAVAFYLLYSGQLGLTYKDGMSGAAKVVGESALYFALAAAVGGVLLMTGVGIAKSLASLIYLVFGIVQLFPGSVMIPQHEGNMGLVVALYAVSLICTIVVFFMISGSEAVGQYFKQRK
ncbi:MAG: ABC transporter permease [Ruminococcus sp.]|nr:ABC transporter permease [Ruminococcus sp.]